MPEIIVTSISGNDVPNDTIVRPITKDEIPRRAAIDDAPATRKSAPFISRARPTIKTKASDKSLSLNLTKMTNGRYRSIRVIVADSSKPLIRVELSYSQQNLADFF